MRILLTVTYDGTDFCGYQIQPDKRTVEQTLEESLEKAVGSRVKTIASGRTDSGVHALSQKVHFDIDADIPPEKFAAAINAFLPKDVKILKSEKVADDFSARYSAKEKTYRYSVVLSKIDEPLLLRYAVAVKFPVNVEKMKEAAKVIEGTHDFKAFCASGSSVKDTVRTVKSIKIVKKGRKIDFFVTGNGFLYNMVRIIAGTLISAGEGKTDVKDIESAFLTGNRDKLGKTMPSEGLCLFSVKYKI